MEISIQDSGEIKVLYFEGSLDTNTAPDAQKRMDEVIEQGNHKILIQLEKLDYVSSAGLRILLVVAKKLKKSEGELRICQINDDVREVFEISGFDTILSVFDNESEALKEF